MAADLVTLIETVAITQFLSPGAKSLGEAALERGQRLATAAVQLLKNVGREPQPVEPKLLVPLVQAAALESDESLSDRWAALLANAADSAQRVAVQPGFVEVLRQLTPADALLLHSLYYPPKGSGLPASQRMLKQFDGLGLSYADINLSVDNLIRLHLCVGRTERGGMFYDPDRPSQIGATVFGKQFMQACSAPAA
ncbi:Abi-alpha family protein [Hymenobacter negativus]|uniref:DUF4393 domain-containing protein n=1 Tax=Hymenobacter negativus TaxID=2795026 RepID=A0ABS3QHZ4_9BACT|nr:Abi-alpha family protein [Hymenobacter negativus]MBO2010873.1 DUF4393 domain-containing protein [Hymenobacter negativus]